MLGASPLPKRPKIAQGYLAVVRRILEARSRPKTPLDALDDDHRSYLDGLLEKDPAPPRSTSDYQNRLHEWPAPRFLVHLIRETALNIQMRICRMSLRSLMNPPPVAGCTELFGRCIAK